jgi:hypothetical protein
MGQSRGLLQRIANASMKLITVVRGIHSEANIFMSHTEVPIYRIVMLCLVRGSEDEKKTAASKTFAQRA